MTDKQNAAVSPDVEPHPLMAQGFAHHREGRLEDAATCYRAILAELPRDFDATHLLGVVALQQGVFEVAQRLIAAALTINPNDVVAIGNLGTSYMRDGQLEPALRWFEMALERRPDSVVAQINAATALHNMARHAEAIPLLRKAYAGAPHSYEICNLLGACLLKMGDAREAADFFEAATTTAPQNAEGWANLSVALNAIGSNVRAADCADKAVALKPNSAAALSALGEAHFNQGRLAAAVESYGKGAALPAPSIDMLLGYAHALIASGLNAEAIEQLRRAVAMESNNLHARWSIAMAHLKPVYDCQADSDLSRQQFALELDAVAEWYEHAASIVKPHDVVGVSQPFYIAYQPLNNRKLLSRYGAICARWMTTLPIEALPLPAERHGKIRVGIAAANIRDHSVWNAITKGWVYHVDKSRFEIYIFQLNPASDAETEKARQAVAGFVNEPTTVAGWVKAIRQTNLDVLIFPEIGMEQMTVRLASMRLAPLQAASWGHPETTGLPTLDWYITGDALEPADAEANYSEKPVRLPRLGVYIEPLQPSITDPDLSALKLPSNEPLLLCPGSPFKYSPQYDEVWVRIAQQLRKRLLRLDSGGRLVFFRSRSDTMDRMLERRLRSAFEAAGVPFDAHVSIIASLDRSRFFGLMKRSALMLDTIGFSGFNTAIQGIECDLPVLAFEGKFMRGRLASAIMRQLDLPELVAGSPDEFIEKAVDLANNARARKRLRSQIIARRDTLYYDTAPLRALEEHLAAAAAKNRASQRVI